LENELEAMLEQERALSQQAAADAAAAASSTPQRPQVLETPQRAGRTGGSSQSSEFHLENELEAMMTTGSQRSVGNELAATPQGQRPMCSQDMEVEEGAAAALPVERVRQVATPQSAASSAANLERDLEAVMEGAADDVEPQAHAAADGGGSAQAPAEVAARGGSQAASGDDSAQFWDEVMQRATPAPTEATQQPPQQRSEEGAPSPAASGGDTALFWDEVMRHATPADPSATQPAQEQQQQQVQTPQRGEEEVPGSQASLSSQQLEFELERIMDEDAPATPRPSQ